jgi:two-component system, chemotaxis family, CheB/CheR fusion protein
MRSSPTSQLVDPLLTASWMPLTQNSQEGRPLPESGSAVQKNEGRPRALVVDDAPDVTEMIAMFLQHAGYDAVMTFSAAEALAAAKSEQFEVIVSDIGMPGMNGYDLAVALRSLPAYKDVPLIAVTGFSIYDDRGRALASGFNAQLTKPINPMTLLDLIKSLRD